MSKRVANHRTNQHNGPYARQRRGRGRGWKDAAAKASAMALHGDVGTSSEFARAAMQAIAGMVSGKESKQKRGRIRQSKRGS